MTNYLKFSKSLPIEYLKLQKKYIKLYGERTIVLMQVGSFHEAYATKTQGYDLKELGDLLNIIVSKKNKKIEEVNEKNPYMLGFPIISTMKFINILIDNNFTVIKIDQVTDPPKPERAITGIYSPGTNIDNITKPQSNNILSIYLEDIKQNKNEYLFVAGLSIIDLSTGKSIIYEAYSTSNDKYYALDEVNKFISYYLPKEIIICFNSIKTKTEKELIKYLELENKIFHNIKLNKEITKISFQKNFFETIFINPTNLNIFEYLDLEKIDYCRISYINLLSYCQDHIKNIINNIEIPDIYINNEVLYIGNNALIQLDVISTNNKVKYNSVLDIIDYTYTPMGKRYLNNQIITPILNITELNKRYNDITLLCKDKLYNEFGLLLKQIHDMERLHRKLKLLNLNPFEVINIIDDYKHILLIIELLIENNICNYFFEKDFINSLQDIIKYYDNIFDLSKIVDITFIDCSHSFYKKNIYPEIDEIQDEIDNISNFNILIEKEFSNLIEDKKQHFKEDSEEKLFVQLNQTDKEGLFITTTKRRSEQIKKKLNQKSLTIDNIEIKLEDLIIKVQSNSVKIFIKQLTNLSHTLNSLKEDIKVILIKYYKKDLEKIYLKFNNFMNKIIDNISYIDFINSGAKLAITNNYCKPIIEEYEKSFIDVKNLRHPIIEKLIEYEYVPHTICLGKDLNGILLYGINSSGKSSLMKAIGISIIIAQIGYYVPADSFKFQPYESLITRISGDDNLFKGLSSYTLEIYEIKNILKRMNDKTLVIADEVCKGTEHNSALVIVMTLLETLNKSKSSFITATHLHELVTFDRINNLTQIKPFHLHVEYDENNRKLIYDRILREGNGKMEYGLDVAKCIMDDDNFINLSEIIKKEYNQENEIVANKKSNYNSKLYMTNCNLCNSRENLETHHINFQKDTDKNGFINKKNKNHIHKNHLSNLIVLCETCHDKIHSNEIELKGFIETSNGREII